MALFNLMIMFEFIATSLENVFEIKMLYFGDDRGGFTKVFQDSIFQEAGIDFQLKESYFSLSKKGVIRGMHFQLPPWQHHKIVYCPKGSILDVAVDLRTNSPTFGKYYSTELSANNHKALLIPEGCAHGFKSIEDDTLTAYLVSSEYQKEFDTGILWDSFGLDWLCSEPIISKRDKSFLPFSAFKSPF